MPTQQDPIDLLRDQLGLTPEEEVQSALATRPDAPEATQLGAAMTIAKFHGIESPDGSAFNSGKPLEASDYLARMQTLVREGAAAIATPEYQEYFALPEGEAREEFAAKQMSWWDAKVATPASELAGRVIAKPYLEEYELDDDTPDDVRQASQRIREESDNDTRPEKISVSAWNSDLAVVDKYRKEIQPKLRARRAVREYEAKLISENAFAQFQGVRKELSPAAEEIVTAAFRSQTLPKPMIDDFKALPFEQQRLVSALIHSARRPSERNAAAEAARGFIHMLVDVPYKAIQHAGVDSIRRALTDEEEYNRFAQTRALLAEAEAPRLKEYGFFGNTLIGMASTIPYIGWTLLPGGTFMVAAHAASEFERQVAADGGDVASPEFMAMKWFTAAAYAAVERLPGMRLKKTLTDLERRAMVLNITRRLNVLYAAGRWGAETFSQTKEEVIQKAMESALVAYATDRNVIRAAVRDSINEVEVVVGTMGGVALFGLGGAHLAARTTSHLTLQEMMAGRLHAVSLIDAHERGDQADIAKHREALAPIAKLWMRAGGNRERALQEFMRRGYDQKTAEAMDSVMAREFRTVMSDQTVTKAQRESFFGKGYEAAEVLAHVMPDVRITANEDGSWTAQRQIGNTVSLTRIEYSNTLGFDPNSPAAASSIVAEINRVAPEAGLTLEEWNGMSPTERRSVVGQYGLYSAGDFRFTTDKGTRFDEGHARTLSGTIALNPASRPSNVVHEALHAFVRYLRETGAISEADIAKARAEFGDPRPGNDEAFDEETAARAYDDYVAGRSRLASGTLMDRIVEAADRMITAAVRFRRQQREAATARTQMFDQITAGTWTGITAAVAPKAKPAPDAKPDTAKAKPQDAPEPPEQPVLAPDAAPAPETPAKASPAPAAKPDPAAAPGGMNLDSVKRKDEAAAERKRQGMTEDDATWHSETPTGNYTISGDMVFADFGDILISRDKGYPAAWQNRKESSVERQKKHDEIKKHPNYKHLGKSDWSNSGSPIIVDAASKGTDSDPDVSFSQKPYIALTGNTRIWAIRDAYAEGKANDYAFWVKAQAARMGVVIPDGWTMPGLFRVVRDANGPLKNIAVNSNEDVVAELSPADRAVTDSRAIIENDLVSKWAPANDGRIDTQSNFDFIVGFKQALNAGGITTALGYLTDEGASRIKRAMIALVFGHEPRGREITARLIEQAHDLGIKREADGITRASGALFYQAEVNPEYSLISELSDAVDDYVGFRTDGRKMTIDDWLNQGSLFGARTPETAALVRAFAQRRTAGGIGALLINYAERARRESPEPDMFGNQPRSKLDLINLAIESTKSEAEQAEIEEAKAEDGSPHVSIPTPAAAPTPKPTPAAKASNADAIAQLAERLTSGEQAPQIQGEVHGAGDLNVVGVQYHPDAYFGETPELLKGAPSQWLTQAGTPSFNAPKALLAYLILGNKRDIIAQHGLPLAAVASLSPGGMWDCFGGAGMYTVGMYDILKSLPPGSRLNEFEFSRGVTLQRIKRDAPGVLTAFDAIFKRFMNRFGVERPQTKEEQNEAADAVRQWFADELNGRHEGAPQYIIDTQNDSDGRIPLHNTNETAAFYLLVQNLMFGSRPLTVAFPKAGGVEPEWVTGDGARISEAEMRPLFGTMGRPMNIKGAIAGGTGKNIHARVTYLAQALKDVDVSIGDGWALAASAPKGSFIPLDTSYFPVFASEPLGVDSAKSKTVIKYGKVTGEDADPAVWTAKMRQLVARLSDNGVHVDDVNFFITNNWDDRVVEALEGMGFVVARAVRKKEGEEVSELIAMSGLFKSIVPSVRRTSKPSDTGVARYSIRSDKPRLTIDQLRQGAESMESWRDWYDKYQGVLVRIFDDDAVLFRDILSVTSQAASVPTNVALALKAYSQLKSGEPFVGYMEGVIKNLDRLREGAGIRGEKIAQYAAANRGDTDAIAVDRHITMLLFNRTKPTKKQIEKAKTRIRQVANRLGWKARETQAALWAWNQTLRGVKPEEVQSYDTILENRADEIAELRRQFNDAGREGTGAPDGGATGPGTQGARYSIAADLSAHGWTPESAQRTQIATTVATYKKMKPMVAGRVLDYGAGKGLGAKEIGADTLEPFPSGWTPDYTDATKIADSTYDTVVNSYVLNVVPDDVRDNIVKDIWRVLRPNGKAIILARGADVNNAKSKARLGDAELITSAGTYQKGFTQAELEAYVRRMLPDATVAKAGIGTTGVVVSKPATRYSIAARVTPAQDAAYLAAVERGDMDTAQRMVNWAARMAGYILHAYHGSPQRPFWIFDPLRRGERTGSNSALLGFFASTYRAVASEYKLTANERYGAMKQGPLGYGLEDAERNVAIAEDIGTDAVYDDEEKGWLAQITDHNQFGDTITYNDGMVYDTKAEALDAADVERDKEIAKAQKRLEEAVEKNRVAAEAMDADRTLHNLYVRLSNPLIYDYDGGTFKDKSYSDLVQEAIDKGHDGVIMKNTRDAVDSDTPSNVIVFFESSQAKLADAVTRDDAGNVIPLSQRFNAETPDIRYSIAAETDPLGLYSQLRAVLDQKMPARQSVRDLRNLTDPQKGTGIKADELQWSGFAAWLDSLPEDAVVTKEQALEAARDFRLEETVLGEEETLPEGWTIRSVEKVSPYRSETSFLALIDPDGNEIDLSVLNDRQRLIQRARRESNLPTEATDTVFSQYTLPGSDPDTYRERLVTVPNASTKRDPDAIREEIDQLLREYNDHIDASNEHDWGDDIEAMREDSKALADEKDEIVGLREELKKAESEEKRVNYQSPHWTGHPNVLLHIRHADRTTAEGKAILVEEIQSDWHQKARGLRDDEVQRVAQEIAGNKPPNDADIAEANRRVPKDFGYRSNNLDVAAASSAMGKANDILLSKNIVYAPSFQRPNYPYARADFVPITSASDTDPETWTAIEIHREALQALASADKDARKVPAAPFSDTSKGWARLAMKRIFRLAAERGVARVLWTTGIVQIRRYEDATRQAVDKIEVVPDVSWRPGLPYRNAAGLLVFKRADGTESAGAATRDAAMRAQAEYAAGLKTTHVVIKASKGEGTVFESDVPLAGSASVNGHDATLEDVIGKEMAAKVRADPDRAHTFEGDDLHIGGEGMVEFYDRILPRIANDLGKRYGAKTTDATLPHDGSMGDTSTATTPDQAEAALRRSEQLEANGVKVHAFDIPEAMRYDILKGQARFSIESSSLADIGQSEQEQDATPQARNAFEATKPDVSGASSAVAVLTVMRLEGREPTNEDAARYIRIFRAQGATPDELVKESREFAESTVGAAARKALESADPSDAAAVVAKHAEMQAIYAAREGAKRGARMGRLAQKAEDEAAKSAIRDAVGTDLQQLVVDTGVDPTLTMLAVLPETFAPGKPKAQDEDGAENPDGEGQGQDSETATAAPEATPEQLADRDARCRNLLDMTKAWYAEREARRQKRAEERAAAQAQREADQEGLPEGKEADDIEDAGGEDAYEADDAELGVIPRELLEGARVDLNNAHEFAHFLRLWMGDWLVEHSNGELTPATVWTDPEAIASYRKTMQAQLSRMADGMLNPGDNAPKLVATMIGELPETGNPNDIERRTAAILSVIQRNAIRQSRKQLIKDIRKGIKEQAAQKKRFNPMEEDIKRKVGAEPEQIARYIRQCIGWTRKRIEKEREALESTISDRATLYDAQTKEPALDVTTDAAHHYAVLKLAVLNRWAGLRELLPGEILAAGNEIMQWIETEQERLQKRWFEIEEANAAQAGALVEAIVAGKPERGRPKLEWTDRLCDSLIATVHQRMRDLIKFADDGPVRDGGLKAADEIRFLLAQGSERYTLLLKGYRDAWTYAVEQVAGKHRSADYMKHLHEDIPAEIAAQVSRQGYHEHFSFGQAMQLYASLTQQFYGRNVAKHDRQDHARLLESVLTPEDMRVLNRLRQIYEERREELSAAVERITGVPVWRPDILYMPVRMQTRTRGGIRSHGAMAWSALSATLTPRQHNDLDFDEAATIQGIYAERAKDAAAAIAYGENGIRIRGIIGRPAVKDAIERYAGKAKAGALYRQVEEALIGERIPSNTPIDKSMDLMLKLNVYTALSGNVVSTAKQMLSTPVWAMTLDGGWKDVQSAVAEVIARPELVREFIDSDGFRARYQGGMIREFHEILIKPGRNWLERAYRTGMLGIQFGDAVPSVLVGAGLFHAKRNAYIDNGMDPETAKQRALTLTWALVEESQQSGRTENMPEIYRSGNVFARAVLQFGSAQLLQLSHELQAWREWHASPTQKTRKALLRAVIVNHVIMPFLMGAVTKAWNALLGDEPPDEEDMPDEIKAALWEMTLGPIGRVAVIGAWAQAGYDAMVRRKTAHWSRLLPAENVFRLTGTLGITAHDIATMRTEDLHEDMLRAIRDMSAPGRHAVKAYRNYIKDKQRRERGHTP